MTCDKRLYFPSEGRRAEDFFALKNPTASAGFEPANLGTKANTLPLDHRSQLVYFNKFSLKTAGVVKEESCFSVRFLFSFFRHFQLLFMLQPVVLTYPTSYIFQGCVVFKAPCLHAYYFF